MVNKVQERQKLYGAIGEIVLLLIVLAAVLLIEFAINKTFEIGFRLTFCMVGILSFKQFYLNTFHAPPKPKKWKHNYICIAITYGIGLVFILITWAYKTEFSLVLLTAGAIAYGNAKLGDWQCKYKQPNIYAMTETQLREHCKSKKLSIIETDIVVYIVIEQLKDIEIYTKIGYSKPQYYVIKRKIKAVIPL